jgi:osmotically-inducible protein OsmY
MDKKRLLCLTPLLLAMLLHGCAATGSGNASNRSIADIRTDTEIEYAANRALVALTPMSAQSHIIVTVFNRVALLTGQTPKVQWREQAVKTVQAIPRLRSVHNDIEIAQPASLPALSQDAYITSSAKTALLRSDKVAGNNVTVITESGVVYLMGLVSNAQANAAADLVRRINGVKKVVLLFEETR